MTIFLPIIDGATLETRVKDQLVSWTPTYLAEIERQNGRVAGTLPVPRSWTHVNDFEKWPEDQLPCVLIISPGLWDQPSRDGQGNYSARWIINVAVIVSTATADDTRIVARLYAAALRAALLQRGSLGGIASGSPLWLGEAYSELPAEDLRSLGAGLELFAIEVKNVVNDRAGPIGPPAVDPIPALPEWPTVLAPTQTIIKEPL